MTEQQTTDTGARPGRIDGNDPALVRESRAIPDSGGANRPEVLRTSDSVFAERRQRVLDRHGGLQWGADFMGFAVATFFTILFLGIVGAVVGAVGYQLNAPVPKIGQTVNSTTVNLGIGALVGSLVALFLAYFLGGYTAGRMARFEGAKQGLGVVAWTVVVAAILGVVGGVLGNQFNVATQLHLKVDMQTLTIGGALSLAVTLLVMLVGAVAGGALGDRYHRAIDRDTEDLS